MKKWVQRRKRESKEWESRMSGEEKDEELLYPFQSNVVAYVGYGLHAVASRLLFLFTRMVSPFVWMGIGLRSVSSTTTQVKRM
mmetsp:Transcript_33804/g.55809  ORF Transcript_33804/g.55809 Transcript_33804/m.55809 type:complete len:83 (+) Transcript_33804:518-766(+)